MLDTVATVYNLSVNLSVGLIILIIINITLDSMDAFFNKEFDWKNLLRSTLKGAIVVVCFFATYFVGYINQDVMVVSIFKEQNLNVMDAVALAVLSAYFIYAKKVIGKLFAFIIAKEKQEEEKTL